MKIRRPPRAEPSLRVPSTRRARRESRRSSPGPGSARAGAFGARQAGRGEEHHERHSTIGDETIGPASLRTVLGRRSAQLLPGFLALLRARVHLERLVVLPRVNDHLAAPRAFREVAPAETPAVVRFASLHDSRLSHLGKSRPSGRRAERSPAAISSCVRRRQHAREQPLYGAPLLSTKSASARPPQKKHQRDPVRLRVTAPVLRSPEARRGRRRGTDSREPCTRARWARARRRRDRTRRPACRRSRPDLAVESAWSTRTRSRYHRCGACRVRDGAGAGTLDSAQPCRFLSRVVRT